MRKGRTPNQRELLGWAGAAGLCVLLTVLMARALWISGGSVRQVDSVQHGRTWETSTFVFFLVIVFDVLVLAAFFKTLKQARKN